MSSTGSVAVIVGASRGIGLELARVYLGQSNLHVVALSRNANEARKSILDTHGSGPLYVHKDSSNGNASKRHSSNIDAKDSIHLDGSRLTTLDVDIKQEDSIEHASEQVRKQFGQDSLRLLFNVAGILHVAKNVKQTEYAHLLEQFQINTFAPLLTAKHFTPLLPRRLEFDQDHQDPANGLLPVNTSVIANMSARVGSIADNQKGGWYGYRASKAAQNQITRTLARELSMRQSPAICVGLHPGTVRTELSQAFTGGPGGKEDQKESEDERRGRGEFEANEAASNLAGVLSELKPEQSGKVFDYAGKEVPF